jgi:hypothetical protein
MTAATHPAEIDLAPKDPGYGTMYGCGACYPSAALGVRRHWFWGAS